MISEDRLRWWLRELRKGRESEQDFIHELKRFPFDNVGIARLDTHRRLRRGLPEVIFCEGKNPQHIIQIARRIIQSRELLILTRLEPCAFEEIHRAVPRLSYDPIARMAYKLSPYRRTLRGAVAVVSGGTSDMPIAEEAARTLELLGSRAIRVYDVGVCGVHRLLGQWNILRRARTIVVVAGMEGALASVVAGLVSCPVIALPTSIGYGASFKGIAPLLAMLNSCAPGIGVVNIDNGFGAGYLAHLVNQRL